LPSLSLHFPALTPTSTLFIRLEPITNPSFITKSFFVCILASPLMKSHPRRDFIKGLVLFDVVKGREPAANTTTGQIVAGLERDPHNPGFL